MMTLKRDEVNEEAAWLPCAEKKCRVVSGRSYPLGVGNLKKRSLTLRSSKEKTVLATLSKEWVSTLSKESIKWHWKWSHGLRLCCSEKCAEREFYLNAERWNQCNTVPSVGNWAKKDNKVSAHLDEHSPASKLVVSEERSKMKLEPSGREWIVFPSGQLGKSEMPLWSESRP